MSDVEKLIDLFKCFGLGYASERSEENQTVTLSLDYYTYPEMAKVIGYSGFTTEFKFDMDGKFISAGLWE